MPDRVRVGLTGTSAWADRIHLPGLCSHPQADLAALCGRNADRAGEMAAKYGIPRIYADYREMIEKERLDALVVSTPDDMHYPIVMDALDAGLHVLCEKPLALNVEQAKTMYERAEAAGVRHMTFFTFRWMPHFRYVRDLTRDGYVGRCYHAHFDFLDDYGRDTAYGWRFDARRANGIVADLGSHMVDMARWYLGDIVRVSGHLATHVEREGVDGRTLSPANDA
ncbi:MAG: Gfo/Idh/MocA family oxidoreductase [candidate division Zixibacteria bacterium]|nr:Gfo/Idh/MocA family oxidoreductase [candidate division Zixibacteria bacterium]